MFYFAVDMGEVKISGMVVCFNEERDIERCLRSLLKVTDEIVVVDSYSTDSTPEICKSLGVRFIQQEFLGYIEQKSFGALQTEYDVILSLDADEELSEDLIKSILEVKSNWKADGFLLNRLTNYCGKWIYHSGWYPDSKLRLFNKQKAKWGGSNPHDKVIMNKGSIVKQLRGDILHYSYYTFEEHVNQINRFSDIASRSLYKRGVKGSVIKVIYKPLARFIKSYIFKLGVLDGKAGFTIAKMTAKASYMKYTKLLKLQKEGA